MPEKENSGRSTFLGMTDGRSTRASQQALAGWAQGALVLQSTLPLDPSRIRRHLQTYPVGDIETLRASTWGMPPEYATAVDNMIGVSERTRGMTTRAYRRAAPPGDHGDVLREHGARGNRTARARRAVRKRAKRARKRTARKRRR